MALLRQLLSLTTTITITGILVKALPLEVETLWGEWSEWTPCSRLCGVGISSQRRSCLDNCKKDDITEERFQSCCIQSCPTDLTTSNHAPDTCSRLSGNWTEVSTGRTGCSVRCVNQTTTDHSRTAMQDILLPSGTSCRTELGRKGVCLKDRCVVVGCDNVLGSGKEEDKCSQCPSPSSVGCQLESGKVPVPLLASAKVTGSVSVLRVPERSSFLNISHPFRGSGMRLAIKESNGQEIFQGGRNGTTFHAAGILFRYFIFSDVDGDKEELLAEGPTKSTAVVQLYGIPVETAGMEAHVYYSYHHLQEASSSTPHGNSTHIYNSNLVTEPESEAIYLWDYMALSQCSVTCGRGARTLVPVCIDKAYPDRMLVDDFCPQLEKPLPIVQPCHIQDCSPEWKRGKWSVCSGGCGEGMQSRLVQCQKFVEDGRNSVVLTDEGACGLERKPAEERPCNVTHCNYNWTISNWSSCPDLDTDGIQYRDVRCHHTITGSVVDHTYCDDGARPPSVRNCRSRNCRNGSCCAWRSRPWGKCDVGCGVGSQGRAIECRYTETDSITDQTCCTGLEEPTSRRQCWSIDASGCSPFWHRGDFGECTGRCCSNNHIKTRTVTCSVSVQGRTVELPDGACSSPKPSANATCSRTNCPTWVVSEWEACSPPRAPYLCGMRIRTVQCVLDGKEVHGCCEDHPLEAQACINCNPTTAPPPVCSGPDLYPLVCHSSVCGNPYFRQFCCATCRKHFS